MRKTVNEADIRPLVRLLGEVVLSNGSPHEKKRQLVSGLARLIHANCWVWTNLETSTPGDRINPPFFLHGGFSDESLAHYLVAQEHPDMAGFNGLFLSCFDEPGQLVTRLRQDLDPSNEFEKSGVFPFWLRADIGPILLSAKSFPDDRYSLIALYRSAGSPLFTSREARLADILFSEVPWLHASEWEDLRHDQPEPLAPRLCTVRTLLLEGLGRKQIAAHLGLSENTISGYVKLIYRHHKVHSHAELLKYFQGKS